MPSGIIALTYCPAALRAAFLCVAFFSLLCYSGGRKVPILFLALPKTKSRILDIVNK